MCLTPQTIPGIDVPVPCRNCWQCRENRVNDLIGRCIAESHTAAHTVAVTLTYSGDSPNAYVLVYADFQNFIKRLRRAGHSVRYIVAGEYGSKKGRAHWHAVLFFHGSIPEDLPEIDTRASWSPWTNQKEGRGFVFLQEPDYNGFRYVLKYVLKGQSGPVGSTHLAMSKKPPLGYHHFMALADDHVEQNLSPQSGMYQFRGVKNAKGQHRKFYLQGRMRELFCEAFIIKYRVHNGRDYPFSEWLLDQEDKWYRDDDQWIRNLTYGPERAFEDLEEQTDDLEVINYPLPRQDMLLERLRDRLGVRPDEFILYFGENDKWHTKSAEQLKDILIAHGVPMHSVERILSAK